jgi:ribosomal protein S12 methylthiotransferase accessory factor YcaO
MFQTYAQLAQTARLGFASIEANAGGIAFTPEEARRAALGEAVERYAATFVASDRLLWATATELGVADDVFRYRRFGPSSPHGVDLD